MIRVGIDTQIAGVSRAGIGHFTNELATKLPLVDHDATYVPLYPNNRTKDFSMPERWWWDQVTLPSMARRERVDALLKPAFACPVRSSIPTVAVLQDLAARRFPSQLHRPSAWYYGRWSPWTLRYAARIIAISEFTANEAVELLNIPRTKIDVILQGVDMMPSLSEEEMASVMEKFHVSGKFVLHVGTIEPRKNLAFLVRAFSRFHVRHPEYALVLAGKEGWLSSDVHAAVSAVNLGNAIKFAGGVNERELQALYRHARVVAFPSLYEGFGRPPLEAMSVGVPVVAADTSSVPEVVGDAGILISGYDEHVWAAALETASEDEGARTRMQYAGIARSMMFSWENAARQFAAIIHDVVHDRR